MKFYGNTIQVDGFGYLNNQSGQDEIVKRYTITNKNNASVRLITFGAGIQSIIVPNKNKILGDVILGFDNIDGYQKYRYLGRLTNDVSDQTNLCDFLKAKKKETDYYFDILNWESCILGDQVVMSCVKESNWDNCRGYLMTEVKFSWTDENKLIVQIFARSTNKLLVNLTYFNFFNLAGHGTGPIDLHKHSLTANADKYSNFTSVNCKPQEINVYKTYYDLRHPTRLSKQKFFRIPGYGFNHIFNINTIDCSCESNKYLYNQFHSRIFHCVSGRFLEINSNFPRLYLYTMNDFPVVRENNHEVKKNHGKVFEKNGALYERHGGIALIPKNSVDSKNDSSNNLLYPGKIYRREIIYHFGVVK